jgi:HD-like signal output (HDOD) protein
MGIVAKIRRHAAVASGNFAVMFKDVVIPPLPAAASRLVTEINHPDPDLERVVTLISSSTGIAAKVIKTVNSSLFGLRESVANVRHAVTLLGFRNIQSIALGYATMTALPEPKGDLFDHEAFWTDSLIRAMMARTFCKRTFPNQYEEAFTASLLADIALPVLLSVWKEYYEPVVQEWQQSPQRLSEIEREQFGWDHAQAGAWIAQSWELPEDVVCYIGAHNLSWADLQEHELHDTIAAPMAVAAHAPSVLKSDLERSKKVFQAAKEWLSMSDSEFEASLGEVQESFANILDFFGYPAGKAETVLRDVATGATPEREQETRDGET